MRPDGPFRIRLYNGNAGEVMALGVSDQKTLLCVGLDQTITAYSLDDWPSQPELGTVSCCVVAAWRAGR